MKEQELKRKKPSYRADAVKVILILLIAIAVLAAGSWFLWTAVPDGGGQSQKSPFLSVKAIEVEGETRYDKAQIIEASGLFVGQSLLAVNKVQAYEQRLYDFMETKHPALLERFEAGSFDESDAAELEAALTEME